MLGRDCRTHQREMRKPPAGVALSGRVSAFVPRRRPPFMLAILRPRQPTVKQPAVLIPPAAFPTKPPALKSPGKRRGLPLRAYAMLCSISRNYVTIYRRLPLFVYETRMLMGAILRRIATRFYAWSAKYRRGRDYFRFEVRNV